MDRHPAILFPFAVNLTLPAALEVTEMLTTTPLVIVPLKVGALNEALSLRLVMVTVTV
jgi:hypothetical protein